MNERRKWRASAARTIALIALGIALGGPESEVRGQDAPKQRSTTAAEQLVAKLKAACERDVKLRGAFVQGDEPRDGILTLAGTIDRQEQAELIEAEAKRLLDATPAWRDQIPGGVSASKMRVFPLVSDLLPRLRSDFAGTRADPPAEPSLLQQTRIDALYFDAGGRLRVAGVCINQRAYVAHRNPEASPEEKPLQKIAQAVHDRLKGYPIPEKVDRNFMARIQADKITFEQNPVRLLQGFANESKLDQVLFREAWFDAKGELRVDGLLEIEGQRTEAATLLSRPEFAKVYARSDGTPPAVAADAVAPMSVAQWGTALRAALQKGFADDVNSQGPASVLRHCRIDRAIFVYPEGGARTLRFEGVVWQSTDAPDPAVGRALLNTSRRAAVFPIPFTYGVLNRLTAIRSPLRALQLKVASTPEMDGVRLDDVVFGPKGEATLEGKWVGLAQAATLEQVLTPVLVEQTRGKVPGPLVRRLAELPTDRLLRTLRARLITSSDESSLGRLFFRPGAEMGSQPQLVLQGATMAARLAETKDQLAGWLKADALNKDVGTAVVELTPRPKSLLTELRKLVASDPALDGVLIKSVSFDEENNLFLSGRQDHEGQADGAIALVEKAAAVAWKGLPQPKAARAGTFAVFPLRALLEKVSRKLPCYKEGDRIILNRAYYDDRAELVLAGGIAEGARETAALTKRIESLIGDDADIKLARLSLTPRPIDAEAEGKIVRRGIEALAAGNLRNFSIDELNEAILTNPSDSTAWYLRGAYYYFNQDQVLANRDLWRTHSLERVSRSTDRIRALERFQGELRRTLEVMVENANDPR